MEITWNSRQSQNVARGMPIVSSDHGVEGIPVTSNGTVNVDHASDAEIAKRLVAWLDSQEKADKDGLEQMRQVAEQFSPQRALSPLLRALHEHPLK